MTLEEMLAQFLAKSTYDEDEKGVVLTYFRSTLDTYKWLNDNKDKSSKALASLLVTLPSVLTTLNGLWGFYSDDELTSML